MNPADTFLMLVRHFVPHHWVGNIETSPKEPHFTSVTHIDGGFNFANNKAWAKVVFVQNGSTHRLIATQVLTEFGEQKPADVELDGLPQKAGGFVLSDQTGIFGVRLIATWKFEDAKGNPVRYRFDGDVI